MDPPFGDSDVGKAVKVLIWRDGIENSVTVTLGRLETVQLSKENNKKRTNKINKFAGMSFTELNDELRNRYDLNEETFGIIIVGIDDNSPAATRGILAGDIIQKVDQVEIKNSIEILNLINLRSKFYIRSNYKIDCDGMTKKQIVKKIKNIYENI